MSDRQINAVQYLVFQGQILEALLAGDIFTRIGMNGEEARDLGYRVRDSRVITLQTYGSLGDATTARAAQEALNNTAVTVIDAHGTTHSNCLIVNVVPHIGVVRSPSSNPAHTHLLRTVWIIRKQV